MMVEKNSFKKALEIFRFFFKIGFFTFGGGWSILAQMQKEYVEKKHWITEEDLLDMTSVGRSVPGVMIANITVIFGYQMGGISCALAALLGITLPSLIVLSGVTLFYEEFRDNPYVARMLIGIRAAVVPIILFAAMKLRKSALKDYTGYLIALVALVLSLFAGMNNIYIVILGAIAGLFIMEVKHGTP